VRPKFGRATLGLIVGESVAHHSRRIEMPGHVYVGRKGLGQQYRF
jgi:hypothetical protein